MRSRAAVAFLLVFAAIGARADVDLDTWVQGAMSARAAKLLEERFPDIGSRSASNQAESTASSVNSTTLVDSTSSSDFIGVALNLAGLSGGTNGASGSDSNSATATVSGYALLSTLESPQDPLDARTYCSRSGRLTRLFSTTIGYDDADKGSPDDRVIIWGAKVTLPLSKRRELCNPAEWGDVTNDLVATFAPFKDVKDAVFARLLELARARGIDTGKLTGEGDDDGPNEANWSQFLAAFGEDDALQVLDLTLQDQPRALDAEVRLQRAISTAVEEYQHRPRFAVEYLTRKRDGSGDVQTVKGVFEYGFESLKLSANVGWESTSAVGKDESGGTAAVSLEWAGGVDDLEGRRPWRFALSGDGKWARKADDQYRAQARFTLPIASGIELPISVTWANRSELIKEDEVRGQIGFTFDTAQLMRLLQPH